MNRIRMKLILAVLLPTTSLGQATWVASLRKADA